MKITTATLRHDKDGISCGLLLNRPRAQPKRKPALGVKACDVPQCRHGDINQGLSPAYRLSVNQTWISQRDVAGSSDRIALSSFSDPREILIHREGIT
jgi:hypothetical protein